MEYVPGNPQEDQRFVGADDTSGHELGRILAEETVKRGVTACECEKAPRVSTTVSSGGRCRDPARGKKNSLGRRRRAEKGKGTLEISAAVDEQSIAVRSSHPLVQMGRIGRDEEQSGQWCGAPGNHVGFLSERVSETEDC